MCISVWLKRVSPVMTDADCCLVFKQKAHTWPIIRVTKETMVSIHTFLSQASEKSWTLALSRWTRVQVLQRRENSCTSLESQFHTPYVWLQLFGVLGVACNKIINQLTNYIMFVFSSLNYSLDFVELLCKRPLQRNFTILGRIVSSPAWHFTYQVAGGWVCWTRITVNCALRLNRENLLNPRPPAEGGGDMTPPNKGSNYKRKFEVLRTICWEVLESIPSQSTLKFGNVASSRAHQTDSVNKSSGRA